MIRFHCDGCRQTLKAHPEDASRQAACPRCGRALTVPASSSRSDDEVGLLVVLPPGGAAPPGRPVLRDAVPVEPGEHAAAKSAPRPAKKRERFPGRVIRTFGGNHFWAVLFGLLGAILLGFCLLFVTLLVLALTGVHDAKDPTGLIFGVVLIGVLTLISFALTARCWGAEAVLTEEGFGISYPFTSPVFYPWQEIRAVYENNQHYAVGLAFSSARNHRLQVHASGGFSSWLHSYYFAEIPKLAEAVQREMGRLRLPRLCADLRDGGEVRFGPVILDDRGLYHRGDLYRWGEVSGVRIDEDYFRVGGTRGRGVCCEVELHEVPNPRLLRDLVREHIDWRGR